MGGYGKGPPLDKTSVRISPCRRISQVALIVRSLEIVVVDRPNDSARLVDWWFDLDTVNYVSIITRFAPHHDLCKAHSPRSRYALFPGRSSIIEA